MQKLGLSHHSRSFKVTDMGTNRKPVCHLALTDILSRTVSNRADYCSNFGQKDGHFAFLRGNVHRLS